MPDVDAEAAAWAVRLDAGPLDPADGARLDAWLSGGRRRRGALLRAQAGLRLLDEAAAPPRAGALSAKPTEGACGARRRRISPVRVSRIAAAAAIVAVSALLALGPSRGDLRTEVGEQRRVMLEDGSVALINTDSRVGVRYADQRRRIVLAQGEAWFQVAKDRERPFVVDAGPVHVQATGTAFSVRRDADGVRVVVSEGHVRVWRDDQPAALSVAAGQAAFVRPAQPLPARAEPTAADDVLAWRRGEIVLNGQTVEEAAREFNRYNTRQLVVDDPVVGRERIVGYFLIDQPEKFALAAARMSDGRVREDGRSIVIENSQ
jgi:transmembrane sensor